MAGWRGDASSLRKLHQILLLGFFISTVLVDASGTGFLLFYQAFHKAKDSINNSQWHS
jgi:hypothetical protein